MIESVRIDDEGPDGTYLVLDDDSQESWTVQDGYRPFVRHRLQITDERLRELDAALQPFRDHWAEGERVRQELRAHRGAGYCTGWAQGQGPCHLEYGHEGDCAPAEGIGAP